MVDDNKRDKKRAVRIPPLCDTVGIQTLNLLIRSQMLYSVELRCHIFCNCECKGSVLFYSRQGFALFFAKTTSKKVKDDRMTLLPRPFWVQNGCYDHSVQMALGWKYTKKHIRETSMSQQDF